MSLYKTGTVSVNNGQNTVTGNGTSFIDIANVQLGDLFTVDGSKFYEIYQVDTNTQVRIRNIVTGGAFAETTVTDGDYAIVRNFTSQTSAEIAAKVLAVQQKWQNREEEMTDWFYTADNWADVTSINGDQLTVMTPNGINNLLGTAAAKDVTTSSTDTTAGRLLKVGDHGLGLSDSPDLPEYKPTDVSDWVSGFVRVRDSLLDTSNDFLGDNNVYGGAIRLSYDGNNKALFANDAIDNTWYGYSYAAGQWKDTVEFLHTGNTNFNEFRFIKGVGIAASTISFVIETHRFTSVPSIAVTSTFTLQTLGGTEIATGITPTLSSSSPGVAVLTVTGQSGINVDAAYRLVSGSLILE